MPPYNFCSDNEYDELDTRGDNHYWQTERPLFVDSAHAYALATPRVLPTPSFHSDRVVAGAHAAARSEVDPDSGGVNPASLHKLQRWGSWRGGWIDR